MGLGCALHCLVPWGSPLPQDCRLNGLGPGGWLHLGKEWSQAGGCGRKWCFLILLFALEGPGWCLYFRLVYTTSA